MSLPLDDQYFTKQILQALEVTHSLVGEVKVNAAALVTLRLESDRIRSEMNSLENAVRGSNGQPSLITKLEILNQKHEALIHSFEKLEKSHEDDAKEQEASRKQMKVQIILILITAIMSFVSTIAFEFISRQSPSHQEKTNIHATESNQGSGGQSQGSGSQAKP